MVDNQFAEGKLKAIKTVLESASPNRHTTVRRIVSLQNFSQLFEVTNELLGNGEPLVSEGPKISRIHTPVTGILQDISIEKIICDEAIVELPESTLKSKYVPPTIHSINAMYYMAAKNIPTPQPQPQPIQAPKDSISMQKQNQQTISLQTSKQPSNSIQIKPTKPITKQPIQHQQFLQTQQSKPEPSKPNQKQSNTKNQLTKPNQQQPVKSNQQQPAYPIEKQQPSKPIEIQYASKPIQTQKSTNQNLQNATKPVQAQNNTFKQVDPQVAITRLNQINNRSLNTTNQFNQQPPINLNSSSLNQSQRNQLANLPGQAPYGDPRFYAPYQNPFTANFSNPLIYPHIPPPSKESTILTLDQHRKVRPGKSATTIEKNDIIITEPIKKKSESESSIDFGADIQKKSTESNVCIEIDKMPLREDVVINEATNDVDMIESAAKPIIEQLIASNPGTQATTQATTQVTTQATTQASTQAATQVVILI